MTLLPANPQARHGPLLWSLVSLFSFHARDWMGGAVALEFSRGIVPCAFARSSGHPATLTRSSDRGKVDDRDSCCHGVARNLCERAKGTAGSDRDCHDHARSAAGGVAALRRAVMARCGAVRPVRRFDFE